MNDSGNGKKAAGITVGVGVVVVVAFFAGGASGVLVGTKALA